MKPKPFLLSLGAAAGVLALVLAPGTSQGQADVAVEDPVLTALVAELVKQQAQIVQNQTKIDESLALIAEDIRIARAYVGRGGGKSSGK